MKTIEKVIAGGTLLAIVIGLLVQQFWFVPYYIDARVEERLRVLNAAAGTPPEVSELQRLVAVNGTKIDAVGATAAANGTKIDGLALTVIETFTQLSK